MRTLNAPARTILRISKSDRLGRPVCSGRGRGIVLEIRTKQPDGKASQTELATSLGIQSAALSKYELRGTAPSAENRKTRETAALLLLWAERVNVEDRSLELQAWIRDQGNFFSEHPSGAVFLQ